MKTTTIFALAIAMSGGCLLATGCQSKAQTEESTPEEAYLFVYHQDADHSLHMATSRDGYTFTAVNDNKPVISGDTIADQHGIRDPHIYRGPDGAYYMTMTDLHISGKEAGYRDTQWERPDEYGWGNNKGLIFMKSTDLVNWTRHNVRLNEIFPEEYGDVGCVWAPETIFDPEAGKMMVYFTIRKVGENLDKGTDIERKTRLYYSYADDDFTTLVTEPQILFNYPDSTKQILDADICPMPDGRYMLSYCAQDGTGGIKVAFSDKINRDYQYTDEMIDSEPGACEAPTAWKRIGEDKWVVMYDIFSIEPHNFGFVETTDFKTFKPIGRFNEGVMKTTNFSSPKHGAIIAAPIADIERLEKKYPSTVAEQDI